MSELPPETVSLYSLATWTNGLAFRSIDFADSGSPVVKLSEVKKGISGQTKFTDSEFDAKYRIRAGDMIFCWSGQPETSIGTYYWRGPDGWLNQHLFRVEPRSAAVINKYFYFLLNSLNPRFVEIARNKQTTGLGHVTKRDLQALRVRLPPLDKQRRIAGVLGALDDLAIADATLACKLRGAAQCAYIAQVSGESESRILGDVLELRYGRSLPASARRPGSVTVFGSAGEVGVHDTALVAGPGVVVGRKGSVGTVHWASGDFFPIDTTFYVQSELPTLFVYFALRQVGLERMNSDSAVPGLNRSHALSRMIRVPTQDNLRKFEEQSTPLWEAADDLDAEASQLRAARDKLLPLLMSGRVRVGEEM
mgnify:FL=1